MLERVKKPSDEVRVPEVARGTAVVVTRYRDEVAKAVVVHPTDLAMLEHSHALLEALDHRPPVPDPSDAELAALASEDRSSAHERVEDLETIAGVLRL